MSPHISVVIDLCLKFVTYDPNYNYDAEDDQEDSMDIEDGGDEDQGERLFYSFLNLLGVIYNMFGVCVGCKTCAQNMFYLAFLHNSNTLTFYLTNTCIASILHNLL